MMTTFAPTVEAPEVSLFHGRRKPAAAPSVEDAAPVEVQPVEEPPAVPCVASKPVPPAWTQGAAFLSPKCHTLAKRLAELREKRTAAFLAQNAARGDRETALASGEDDSEPWNRERAAQSEIERLSSNLEAIKGELVAAVRSEVPGASQRARTVTHAAHRQRCADAARHIQSALDALRRAVEVHTEPAGGCPIETLETEVRALLGEVKDPAGKRIADDVSGIRRGFPGLALDQWIHSLENMVKNLTA